MPEPKNILFPKKGLDRSAGFQQGPPPYSSPDLQNVRPGENMPGRYRDGSRPGLNRYDVPRTGTSLGSGAVGNMLGVVEYQRTAVDNYVEDSADTVGIDSQFTSSTGGLTEPRIDTDRKLYWYQATTWVASKQYGFGQLVQRATGVTVFWYECTVSGKSAATEPAWPAFLGDTVVDGEVTWTARTKVGGLILADQNQRIHSDADIEETLTMLVVPYRSAIAGTFKLYFAMDDAVPNPADECIEAAFVFTGSNNIAVTVKHIAGGATVTTLNGSVNLAYVDSVLLRVVWVNNLIYVRVNQTLVIDAGDILIDVIAGNSRMGWSMAPTAVGDRVQVDWWRANFQYATGTTATREVTRMAVGFGGQVYKEGDDQSQANLFTEIDSTKRINSVFKVRTAQLGGKLYIADFGLIFEDTDAASRDTGAAPQNVAFETNPNVNLTALGVDPINHVVEIVSYSGTAAQIAVGNALVPPGAYKFTVTTTGAGTNDTIQLVRQTNSLFVPTGPPNAHIRIHRAPKVYDPTAGTLTILAAPDSILTENNTTYGTVPVGMTLIAAYENRLHLAGGRDCFAAESGDPTKWYFGNASGATRAFSYNLSPFAGFGSTITCIFQAAKGRFVVATASGIAMEAGILTDGGYMRGINADYGIVKGDAYCLLPDGSIVYYSRDGVWKIQPQPEAIPIPLSKGPIPSELQNFDVNQVYAMLSYDPINSGIYISVTGATGARNALNWWLALDGSGWFPDTPQAAQQTLATGWAGGYYNNQRRLIVAGRDGHLYYFDRRYNTDAGARINARMVLGPFMINQPQMGVFLNQIDLIMGGDNGTANIQVYTGRTAEEAVRNAIQRTSKRYSRSTRKGLNPSMFPQVAGGAFCIRIEESGFEPWQIEQLMAWVEPAGMVARG